MSNKQIIVTSRTRTVGQNFATVGELVDLNGTVVVTGPRKPFGFDGAALEAVEELAEEGGYVVVSDDE